MTAQPEPKSAYIKAPPISDKVWKTHEPQELTGENLRMLFDNEIPLIRIPNFAEPSEMERMVTAFDAVKPSIEFDLRQREDEPYLAARALGIPQFNYRHLAPLSHS